MASNKTMEATGADSIGVPAVVQQFAQMVGLVPLRGEEGDDTMLAAILNAESVDDLDGAWTGETAKVLNRPITVTDISRMPSDIPDNPLGFFLVVEATDQATGEQLVWTTGSKYVVAQLVRAHVAGWLPMACCLRQSDKPTKAGFYPQHLETYEPEGTL